jgi:hypothetical protein
MWGRRRTLIVERRPPMPTSRVRPSGDFPPFLQVVKSSYREIRYGVTHRILALKILEGKQDE